MGTSDLFCAICGGPFCKFDISPHNRSEVFKAAFARSKEPPEDLDFDDPAWGEWHSYDPEVVYDDFVAWAANAGLLGFNPTVQGRDQWG